MAFISELHYLNSTARATGIDEYVEVTLTPEEAARDGDFQIATYEQDGSLSDTVTLSDLTPFEDPATGFFIYTFETITTDPDGGNGNAEAIALVDNSLANPVLTFVDIGRDTTGIEAAAGTPAAGAVSVNIPAATGESIQFDINGNRVDGDVSVNSSVVCFANGTQIATPDGFVAIEQLRVGDMVSTRDAGAQPIKWLAARRISYLEMLGNPNLRPVVIPGAPDLRVSRQHRVLLSGPAARRMFDVEEILVPAKDLLGYCGVYEERTADDLCYFHILLEDHHVINANGFAAESLYLGADGINAMTPAARKELQTIFPDLRDPLTFKAPSLCRTAHAGRRARQLARRQEKNGRPIVMPFDEACC